MIKNKSQRFVFFYFMKKAFPPKKNKLDFFKLNEPPPPPKKKKLKTLRQKKQNIETFLVPPQPPKIKGQWGVPLTVAHKYPLYRPYIGISHRGTLGPGYIPLSPDKNFVEFSAKPPKRLHLLPRQVVKTDGCRTASG